MPTSSKQAPKKKQSLGQGIKTRAKDFLARRPHRSFRKTRRRDAVKPLVLPGYFAFTGLVNKTLWQHKKTFLLLALVYAVLYGVLVGLGSQETYSALTDTLRTTGSEVFQGDWAQVGQASLLFLTITTVGISSTPTEAQQIYAALLALLVWLTTVWLLRSYMAGHKVKLRDGLYSAGAPLVAIFIITLVMLVQLIPVAVAALGYAAALSSGLLTGGVEAMLFWFAAGLLGVLSAFWITSTIFALIIVTLPGMYPFRALKTAGDMVLGRRVRILLRWAWMSLVVLLSWVVVLIPVILLDGWLKGIWPAIEWLPLVPVVALLLSTLTVMWVSTYVYVLYRKVVDNDVKPA